MSLEDFLGLGLGLVPKRQYSMFQGSFMVQWSAQKLEKTPGSHFQIPQSPIFFFLSFQLYERHENPMFNYPHLACLFQFGLFGPLHFYLSKYKEKTSSNHNASYSLDSCPFSMGTVHPSCKLYLIDHNNKTSYF